MGSPPWGRVVAPGQTGHGPRGRPDLPRGGRVLRAGPTGRVMKGRVAGDFPPSRGGLEGPSA
eukprot:13204871-Alexandrium_andersonii.AAC.1